MKLMPIYKLLLTENSNTYVAYHGTRRMFDSFKSFYPRGAIGNPQAAYFAPDLDTAMRFAEDENGEVDEKSRVIKVQLTIDSDADGKVIDHSYSGREIQMYNMDKIKILDANILRKNT